MAWCWNLLSATKYEVYELLEHFSPDEIAGMVSKFGLFLALLRTGAQNGAGDRFWPFHRFMTIPGVLDTHYD